MTEEQLDGAQIGAGLQQVNGKGVAQGMRRDGFTDVASPSCRCAGDRDRVSGDRLVGKIAGKQPRPWSGGAPVVAQDGQQLGREHDVAILAPLALLDANDHSLTVYGGRRQADGFGYPQACRVAYG